MKDKVKAYIKECYEGDRNNGVFESYFYQYNTPHQKVNYNGETIYLEMVEGQVEQAYNEKDFFYNVILNDDSYIELVMQDISIEHIDECLGLK